MEGLFLSDDRGSLWAGVWVATWEESVSHDLSRLSPGDIVGGAEVWPARQTRFTHSTTRVALHDVA